MKSYILIVWCLVGFVPFAVFAQNGLGIIDQQLQNHKPGTPAWGGGMPGVPSGQRGYYPRGTTTVVPNPGASRTSIAPGQQRQGAAVQYPRQPVVGNKPVLYTDPNSWNPDTNTGCKPCYDMEQWYKARGIELSDYFDLRDPPRGPDGFPSIPIPGIAGASSGRPSTEAVINQRIKDVDAANGVIIPSGLQPANMIRQATAKGDMYYLASRFDAGALPPTIKDHMGTVRSTAEIYQKYLRGEIVFGVNYDPKTGAVVNFKPLSPKDTPAVIDPKKVPNPRDISAVDDDPMFDPPPKKAPETITFGEAEKKIDILRKMLERIERDDAEKAKAGAASGSR